MASFVLRSGIEIPFVGQRLRIDKDIAPDKNSQRQAVPGESRHAFPGESNAQENSLSRSNIDALRRPSLQVAMTKTPINPLCVVKESTMFRLSLVLTTLLTTLLLSVRPTFAQQFSDTAYAKRVLAFRQLEREILDKQIESEGMLRVAGELQRLKPRPRSEAQLMVPRYDDFTQTMLQARQQDKEIMAVIATLQSSADVAALRQKLEIAKRSMELDFKKQQSQNANLRKGQRRKGTKAKDNQRLQLVIQQQKLAKQAYDYRLNIIAEQLRSLRGIEAAGAPGSERDSAGDRLHHLMTNFEFVVTPSREKGREWVEKQAVYARLDSTEQRVVKRDAYQKNSEALQREVDQLIDEAANLVSGNAAGDDLQQLANLLQQQIVNPAAAVHIELTAPNTDSVSHAPGKSISTLRQRMTFNGKFQGMEFTATLSPALTLEEVHAPQWALKFKDKYPMVHSGGVLSLWVGQFYIAISPSNDAARQASPRKPTNHASMDRRHAQIG